MEELKSRVMTKIFMVKALMEKVPPTEILPGIYLSGIVSALNPQVLSEYKIQHIVNCSTADNAFEHGYMQGLDAYAPKNQLEAPSTPPPKYIRIDILDQPYVDIATHFDPLFQQLSRTDGPILFHCVAGVSRSTTLLISYLVRRGQETKD
ncbi:protein-tyrosine phosphatase-like protein [Gorgonomyces haynaldii]|nr:protein-tyrosine phosphatase-like protein [Gorgonomyces haynaldii]